MKWMLLEGAELGLSVKEGSREKVVSELWFDERTGVHRSHSKEGGERAQARNARSCKNSPNNEATPTDGKMWTPRNLSHVVSFLFCREKAKVHTGPGHPDIKGRTIQSPGLYHPKFTLLPVQLKVGHRVKMFGWEVS